MVIERLWRRILLQVGAAWRGLMSLLGLDADPTVDVHTMVTFRSVTDAVIPKTPALADELGAENVPGGLAIDLDDFLVIYVDNLFQFGLPHFGVQGNLPLASPVAHILDAAALTLLARNENESEPSSNRVVSLLGPDDPAPTVVRAADGVFAKLSRRDRLRAISLLDEFEIEIVMVPFENTLFEFDAGVMGQLVIGFTEMIYYSEWQGYDEFTQPPSERVHPNDPLAVQSWRQTGYPGFADGYAVLRGYLGTDESSLGDGETWVTIDDGAASPVRIVRQSGTFRENDYDTSEYEEPYPEGAI